MTTLRPEDEDRFISKIQTALNDSCWLWNAGRDWDGYGHFWVSGRTTKAHRIAYELAVGDVPQGMFVCHHCDNPSCVYPPHLFCGSPQENVADMVRKNRQARVGLKVKTRGELHSTAKLTERQVLELRTRAKAGEPLKSLAAAFGLSSSGVQRIKYRKSWTHI